MLRRRLLTSAVNFNIRLSRVAVHPLLQRKLKPHKPTIFETTSSVLSYSSFGRGYCTKGHTGTDGKGVRTTTSERLSAVDVDKELLRYNIKEFYPDEDDDESVSSETEIEDFGDVEASSKIIDVDKELGRYNVDEFYGIDLEEQHIKPVSEDELMRQLPFELKRGVRGVFEVGELCELLEQENMWDICAIDIPKEMNYVHHIVIASGTSKRHLRAVAQQVKSIWKHKKNPTDHRSIYVEGLKEKADDWFAVDLGNIALHLMLEETRLKYDLETLWTCGPEFDPQCVRTMDQYVLSSPKQLSDEDDPDNLFIELARTFSKRHEEPDFYDNLTHNKPTVGFKFGASERVDWDASKVLSDQVNKQVLDSDTSVNTQSKDNLNNEYSYNTYKCANDSQEYAHTANNAQEFRHLMDEEIPKHIVAKIEQKLHKEIGSGPKTEFKVHSKQWHPKPDSD